MEEEYVSIAVAGMRIEFRASGCKLSDRGFRGFALSPNSAWRPEPMDIIVVQLTTAAEVELPDGAVSSFSAFAKDNKDPDVRDKCDWHLQVMGDGTEVITVFYEGRNAEKIRAAQISFKRATATLIVVPEDENQAVSPFVFPLFNLFLSRLLLQRGGFLIHSSCVCVGVGKGMLFTAPSGTGKSTIAGLFKKSGGIVINDDIVAVRPSSTTDPRPTAYAVPMVAYRQKPTSTLLKAAFLISQSPENKIVRLGNNAMAVARLMSNIIQQPLDADSISKLTEAVANVLQNIAIYTLGFKPDGEVVKLVKSEIRTLRR